MVYIDDHLLYFDLWLIRHYKLVQIRCVVSQDPRYLALRLGPRLLDNFLLVRVDGRDHSLDVPVEEAIIDALVALEHAFEVVLDEVIVHI
jgi:hypothetical protein